MPAWPVPASRGLWDLKTLGAAGTPSTVTGGMEKQWDILPPASFWSAQILTHWPSSSTCSFLKITPYQLTHRVLLSLSLFSIVNPTCLSMGYLTMTPFPNTVSNDFSSGKENASEAGRNPATSTIYLCDCTTRTLFLLYLNYI